MPLFQEIPRHIDTLMKQTGLEKSDINSVELIGGTSRIPIVNKIVKEYFEGIEVGSHMNGDEAMALGSSYRAANLSITFRVKRVEVDDGFTEPVKVEIKQGGETVKEVLKTGCNHG